MPGNIPIRKSSASRFPVPGWTREYDWQGYIPFDQLLNLLNPESGFIVTANTNVQPEDNPYLIRTDSDGGIRLKHNVELIISATVQLIFHLFKIFKQTITKQAQKRLFHC